MSENTMLDLAREVMIGFGEYCGMEITAIDGERLDARMPLRPEFLNVHGFAHGGAVNTLMDTSAGILATFANIPPRRVVTRSADMHFVRPLGGKEMRSEARVIKHGKTCCLVNTDIFDDAGRLCAVGCFDLVYITLPGEDALIEKLRRYDTRLGDGGACE